MISSRAVAISAIRRLTHQTLLSRATINCSRHVVITPDSPTLTMPATLVAATVHLQPHGSSSRAVITMATAAIQLPPPVVTMAYLPILVVNYRARSVASRRMHAWQPTRFAGMAQIQVSPPMTVVPLLTALPLSTRPLPMVLM